MAASEEEKHQLLDVGDTDIEEDSDEEPESAPTKLRRKLCRCIDTRMIPSKAMFFINDAAQVMYLSYVIIFMTSIGLSVKEAGVISGFSMISALVAAPIWGIMADCTKSRKLIFVILVLGASITILPLPWAAASFPSFIDESERFATGKFWTVFFMLCLFVSFLNPIRGFTVSLVMGVVKKTPGAEYGMQTLFGGVGVSICSLIAGLLLEVFHSDTLSPFSPIFWFFVPLCLLLIPAGLTTASQAEAGNGKNKNENEEEDKAGRMQLLSSITNIPNSVFIMSVVISGLCNNAIGTYLFQLMSDQMGASNIAMGLARMFSGIGEIFVFLYAGKVINCLGGPINSIMVSILSFSARFLLLSFITNGWWVLPTQLLHGLSFALFWVSVAEYTYTIAADKIYTTVFSIVVSSYSNVGGVLGTFISGIIYDDFSGSDLFFGVGCLAGCWSLFMLIFFHVHKLSSCQK